MCHDFRIISYFYKENYIIYCKAWHFFNLCHNTIGGFGENQKVILAKTIAEIHEMELKFVNQLINSNINEFEIGIDLKVVGSVNHNFEELGFTKMQVSKANNIYLLSEQGYMILVGFMKTEKAKELRKQIIKLSNSNVKDMHIRRLENRGENFLLILIYNLEKVNY